ncbi:uncharacterized protein SPSK_07374 [Sporothrix schenckii 1099-18]|uniref:DUF7053 domain-containing protein n=1 Tax=Sporothrix schenckii 1099-18 TaxID=1397361 RepID=A0A0F2MGZ1_SPOSC|nr:uncharacterized protein SPSK_07374 [Sporothrix schenckii 1099-18]KJR88912.1 hypothetical protein SPSK_07374 [Sporothrix schenckii 1099-18]
MTSMLRKKELVTIVTPIPGFIPRQLAIDILHSHSEVITLNPLVLSHKPIKAPRDAASDEYYSTWYEITERIQYVPGIGKMGSGKLAFNACFHDMPWGLQAHIYAPMNTDLRYKYRIAGNQPGVEPPETLEMGLMALGAPSDGLYLREDVEVKCSIAVMSFVKSQLKAASKLMVERIIKKAELVDGGALTAMIENGRLKTINPADRSHTLSAAAAGAGAGASSAASPAMTTASTSPALPSAHEKDTLATAQHQQGSPQSHTETPGSPPPVPYQVPRPQSMMPQGLQSPSPYGYRPGSAGVNQQYPQQPPGSPGLGIGAYPPYSAHPGHASYAGTPGGGYYQQPMHPALYPQYTGQHPPPHPQQQPYPYPPPPQQFYAELQAYPQHQLPPQQHLAPGQAAAVAVEMPGDYYYAQAAQQPQQPQRAHSSAGSTPQTNRDSDILTTGQWSAPNQQQPGQPPNAARPNSVASTNSGSGTGNGHAPPANANGFRSPGLDKSFSSELATHRETPDEHRLEALKKLDPTATPAALNLAHHPALKDQPPSSQDQGKQGYAYDGAEYGTPVQGR